MTQAQTTSTGFDIDQLDSETEETLFKLAVISDIDGNDKSGFYIASKNSAEYQQAARQARIDGLKRSSKRKTVLDTSTDEGASAVAKMIESTDILLASSVVKNWFGFESKGLPVPFDKQVVLKMLTKMPTWKDKITTALENETNFLKAS
jgi:hypothetical protein